MTALNPAVKNSTYAAWDDGLLEVGVDLEGLIAGLSGGRFGGATPSLRELLAGARPGFVRPAGSDDQRFGVPVAPDFQLNHFHAADDGFQAWLRVTDARLARALARGAVEVWPLPVAALQATAAGWVMSSIIRLDLLHEGPLLTATTLSSRP